MKMLLMMFVVPMIIPLCFALPPLVCAALLRLDETKNGVDLSRNATP